jgi:hypothetical protein
MLLSEALRILNEAGYSIAEESAKTTYKKALYIMKYLYKGLEDFCKEFNSKSGEDIIKINNDIANPERHIYLFKVEMDKIEPFYIMSDSFHVTEVVEIKFIWGSITYAPELSYKHKVDYWSDDLIENALDEIKSYILKIVG